MKSSITRSLTSPCRSWTWVSSWFNLSLRLSKVNSPAVIPFWTAKRSKNNEIISLKLKAILKWLTGKRTVLWVLFNLNDSFYCVILLKVAKAESRRIIILDFLSNLLGDTITIAIIHVQVFETDLKWVNPTFLPAFISSDNCFDNLYVGRIRHKW